MKLEGMVWCGRCGGWTGDLIAHQDGGECGLMKMARIAEDVNPDRVSELEYRVGELEDERGELLKRLGEGG